ncbi:MAG: cyclopropane fatty acyl phospholipid synthase [Planctomycetota bacterium]
MPKAKSGSHRLHPAVGSLAGRGSRRQPRSHAILQRLLEPIDVTLNGTRPWDVQVHHPAFCDRVLAQGSLGMGESYMDGWWDCAALDELFDRVIRAEIGVRPPSLRERLGRWLLNLQSRRRAWQVARVHYDLGNDLYERMLDSRLVYSCGFWDGARSLDEAQENKLEMVCRKLQLTAGQRVLDVGCGWGGFAGYAAQHYGAEVVGIANSIEQLRLASKRYTELPILFRHCDYREASGSYDCVTSIGMLEHVGPKNYRVFVDTLARTLRDDGIALVHSIFRNDDAYAGEPWTVKYIFPNSITPVAGEFFAALAGRFVVEDVQNIGPHYDPTLMAWHRRFQEAWPALRARYDERFKRMWEYYLLMAAGNFRARSSQVLQIVLTKPGRAQPGIRHVGRSASSAMPSAAAPGGEPADH